MRILSFAPATLAVLAAIVLLVTGGQEVRLLVAILLNIAFYLFLGGIVFFSCFPKSDQKTSSPVRA